MKISALTTAFLAALTLAAPVFAQSEGDPNCTSDGYCPVYGMDGAILYYTRPANWFSSADGQEFLATAAAPEEDTPVLVIVPERQKREPNYILQEGVVLPINQKGS